MNPRSIAAALIALCICAMAVVHANESATFIIEIQLRFDPAIASSPVARGIKEEATDIWRPYGVHLKWTDDRAAEAGPADLALEVRIEQRPEESVRRGAATVLGQTSVPVNAPNAPPIHVWYGAVQHMLALRTASQLSQMPLVHNREMARALGRVLAHEIGHLLLGAPYHDRTGLMRLTFPADELVELSRARFLLSSNSIPRLRSRLCLLQAARAPTFGLGDATPLWTRAPLAVCDCPAHERAHGPHDRRRASSYDVREAQRPRIQTAV
jgi:hypothetical protein